MPFYPVKTFAIFKSIFNKWVWSMPTQQKEVYLTFDDGPVPEITPWVLEQLEQFNGKATFFCIGDNIKKHPEIFKQVVQKGHRVGNHTFHHLNGWHTPLNVYLSNTLKTEELLIKNNKRKLFRPPYGKLTLKQSKALRKLGYQIIMWDVLSADFDQNISAKKCTKNVLKNIQKGSIVVFHDSQKAFPRLKETLPKVLAICNKNGFVFKAIP